MKENVTAASRWWKHAFSEHFTVGLVVAGLMPMDWVR